MSSTDGLVSYYPPFRKKSYKVRWIRANRSFFTFYFTFVFYILNEINRNKYVIYSDWLVMLNLLAFVRQKHHFCLVPNALTPTNLFSRLSFCTHPLIPVDNTMTKHNLTIDEVNALISDLINNSSVSNYGWVLACRAGKRFHNQIF